MGLFARLLLQALGLLAFLLVTYSCLALFTARPLCSGLGCSPTAKAQIAGFAVALETYRAEVGSFPTNAQGLDALIRVPKNLRAQRRWKGPYLADCTQIPYDPWGGSYVYLAQDKGKSASITSYGRDRRRGGEGEAEDIVKTLTPKS